MSQPLSFIENPAFRVDVLSRSEIERIHTATLDIIETAGVKFPLPHALDILESTARRLTATSSARIPAVVTDALKSAPPAYTLAARDPARPPDGRQSRLPRHGWLRGAGDDLEPAPCTALPKRTWPAPRWWPTPWSEVGFWWAMISAQDCPPQSRGLHELEAAWNNTTKHLQTESLLHPGEMHAAVEMAAAVAGEREDFAAARPFHYAVHHQPPCPRSRQPGSRTDCRGGWSACRRT